MIKWISAVALVVLALGSAKPANATPSNWECEGTIVSMLIANENYYAASTPARVVFSVSGCTNNGSPSGFVFNLHSTDLVRSWISELLTAKANGLTVRVNAAGPDGAVYTESVTGFMWADNILVF